MPKIISVGTALPPFRIDQDEAREFSRIMFRDSFKDINRLLKIFESTNISNRYFCVPIEWFNSDHSFEEKNILYVKNAIELGKNAIKNALIKTSFATKDIDHIFFVSSTGLSTPSIDAYLFNDPHLHFPTNIKRTPIWGLGCAGGAAGLSRAFEYTKAFPNEKVLLLALELGELAFLKNDLSKSNLIATSLFADGAAAVLVTGDEVKNETKEELKIVSSYSKIWENSLDIMGWDVKNNGLKVIFSKDIPSLVKNKLGEVVDDFLQQHGLEREDIQFFVLHPGGSKVIEAYKEVLQLDEKHLRVTKGVLNKYGNMSSPTVLFVLNEVMNTCTEKKGHGLLIALGPGFSAELVLLKWEG